MGWLRSGLLSGHLDVQTDGLDVAPESRGEPVSVSEGGRQAIQVNLIAADAQ